MKTETMTLQMVGTAENNLFGSDIYRNQGRILSIGICLKAVGDRAADYTFATESSAWFIQHKQGIDTIRIKDGGWLRCEDPAQHFDISLSIGSIVDVAMTIVTDEDELTMSKLDWQEHFDHYDNSYWQAASPIHDEGSPFHWRIRQKHTDNKITFYLDHDNELPASERSRTDWANLNNAQHMVEKQNDALIADLKKEAQSEDQIYKVGCREGDLQQCVTRHGVEMSNDEIADRMNEMEIEIKNAKADPEIWSKGELMGRAIRESEGLKITLNMLQAKLTANNMQRPCVGMFFRLDRFVKELKK